MSFERAAKRPRSIKFFLMAESEGGKTYTALQMARDIGGEWAMIETDDGRYLDYYDKFDLGEWLDVEELSVDERRKPHVYEHKFIEVKAARRYKGVIIDTFSPWWEGVNDVVEETAARRTKAGSRPNSFNAWAGEGGGNQVFYRMTSLLAAQRELHVILTVRLKDAYDVYSEEVDSGTGRTRTKIEKVGLKPIYRPGAHRFEWSFVGLMKAAKNGHRMLSFEKAGSCEELYGKTFDNPGKEVTDIMLSWAGENGD